MGCPRWDAIWHVMQYHNLHTSTYVYQYIWIPSLVSLPSLSPQGSSTILAHQIASPLLGEPSHKKPASQLWQHRTAATNGIQKLLLSSTVNKSMYPGTVNNFTGKLNIQMLISTPTWLLYIHVNLVINKYNNFLSLLVRICHVPSWLVIKYMYSVYNPMAIPVSDINHS